MKHLCWPWKAAKSEDEVRTLAAVGMFGRKLQAHLLAVRTHLLSEDPGISGQALHGWGHEVMKGTLKAPNRRMAEVLGLQPGAGSAAVRLRASSLGVRHSKGHSFMQGAPTIASLCCTTRTKAGLYLYQIKALKSKVLAQLNWTELLCVASRPTGGDDVVFKAIATAYKALTEAAVMPSSDEHL